VRVRVSGLGCGRGPMGTAGVTIGPGVRARVYVCVSVSVVKNCGHAYHRH